MLTTETNANVQTDAHKAHRISDTQSLKQAERLLITAASFISGFFFCQMSFRENQNQTLSSKQPDLKKKKNPIKSDNRSVLNLICLNIPTKSFFPPQTADPTIPETTHALPKTKSTTIPHHYCIYSGPGVLFHYFLPWAGDVKLF